MKTVGLITEYNPFHNGHAYHIEQAKNMADAEHAVVIMSGNFVQRGTPAVLPKQERTQMALKNGADLVIELPVIYATASAEYFAEGAICLLDHLGIIDSVCFGSECGDTGLLSYLADILLEEPSFYKEQLRTELKQGYSYPLARSRALLAFLNSSETDSEIAHTGLREVLASPNNILGIEYIKALKKYKSAIKPYALTRINSGYHDAELASGISSATAIRRAVTESKDLDPLKTQVPKSVFDILSRSLNNCFPLGENDFSLILKYKLMGLSHDQLCSFADISPELASRILRLLDQYQTYSQFCSLLKTKELTYSRISRALLHIVLDVKSEQFAERIPSYIRVLGFHKQSIRLLTEIKKQSHLPLLTNLADAVNILDERGVRVLEHELYTSNVYYSVLADRFKQPCRNEYRIPIIKEEAAH